MCLNIFFILSFFDPRHLLKCATCPLAKVRHFLHGLPAPVGSTLSFMFSSPTSSGLNFIKSHSAPSCSSYLSSFAQIVNTFSTLVFPWLIFIPLITFNLGVDSYSRSFLTPKTESPFVPPLCSVPSSVLTLSQPHHSLTSC